MEKDSSHCAVVCVGNNALNAWEVLFYLLDVCFQKLVVLQTILHCFSQTCSRRTLLNMVISSFSRGSLLKEHVYNYEYSPIKRVRAALGWSPPNQGSCIDPTKLPYPYFGSDPRCLITSQLLVKDAPVLYVYESTSEGHKVPLALAVCEPDINPDPHIASRYAPDIRRIRIRICGLYGKEGCVEWFTALLYRSEDLFKSAFSSR